MRNYTRSDSVSLVQYNSQNIPNIDRPIPKSYPPLHRIAIFSIMLMTIGIGIFIFSAFISSNFTLQTAKIAEITESPTSASNSAFTQTTTVAEQSSKTSLTPIIKGLQSLSCGIQCIGNNGFSSWNSCQLECKY